MRVIQVIINENGNVGVDKFDSFEGENNATKLLFDIPESWKANNLYLDAIYTNQSGTEQKIQFPPLSEVNGEIAFLVPQVLTFSAKVGFQFLIKNTAGDIIQNSDVFNLFFKKSILADPGTIPEMEDIINFLVRTVDALDRTLDNTIQDIFNKDTAINLKVDTYIRSNDAALAQEISDRIAADESLYEDLTQGIENAKQQVKDEIIGGAPSAFDTLVEIAAIFQNDPNLVATILNTLATKVDKIAGKGLSTNDLTNELKAAYDLAVTNNHTHANKAVLDLITDLVKAGYDNAASKAHNHTDLATLNALTAVWKLAVDDVVSRLAAKWMGSDINLNQIGLTHLTAALQQLIGSNNNITNYPDNLSLISYVENSVNKLRFAGNWGEDKKGYLLDGSTAYVSSGFTGQVNAIAFWIYPTANNRGILNFGTNMTVSISSGNAITLGSAITNSTIYINTFATTAITLNTWNFVMISCDAFTATVFEYGRTSTYFAGKISNLFLFNRAFVAADYFNFFNNGVATDFVMPYYEKNASNNNIILNGTFDTDTVWTKGAGVTITGGVLRCNISSSNTYQSVTNGKFYRKKYYVSVQVSNYVSGSFTISIGGYNVSAAISTTTSFVLDVNNGLSNSIVYISSSNFVGDIDNIIIYQIGCVCELRGENAGNITMIDSSGNGYHGTINGTMSVLEKQNTQKAWTGNFTTNIAAGTANKDVTIPSGYMIETITLTNSTSGNITNFQAILNHASWNQTLFSGKTAASSAILEVSTLADRYVDKVNNMTLRFNCTGNGTGGIDIMVSLRRKD